MHQLYNHVGKNPTYRPDCFEVNIIIFRCCDLMLQFKNSRKYLLWMRAEEMEIDNLIEGLKREAPYQGRLHLGGTDKCESINDLLTQSFSCRSF